MDTYSIIAQTFGIIAMGLIILSFQAKKQRTLILSHFFGCAFFVINFFMIGAITGAFMNIIGVVRAVVYSNKDKFRNMKLSNIIFCTLYIVAYALTFTVFKKEITTFNLIVEILPVTGALATTIAFSMPSAAAVRKAAWINSPAWLIYNSLNFSIGGILCEVFSIISVIIGILRHDVKKNNK